MAADIPPFCLRCGVHHEPPPRRRFAWPWRR